VSESRNEEEITICVPLGLFVEVDVLYFVRAPLFLEEKQNPERKRTGPELAFMPMGFPVFNDMGLDIRCELRRRHCIYEFEYQLYLGASQNLSREEGNPSKTEKLVVAGVKAV